MKKSIAVIYRLAFILFSVWAILENVAFQLQMIGVKLLDFTVFADVINLICVTIVFLVSLRHALPKGMLFFKASCTFLSVLALAANLDMLFSIHDSSWILNVLLPLMMIVDYLIFDKHSRLKLWQILLGLIGTTLLVALLYLLASKALHLPNALDLLNLFSNEKELIQVLLNTGFIVGGLYLLDRLLSGELFRDIHSMLALLLRLLFLFLEFQAFMRLSGMNLTTFLQSLRYYENLVNFLSFLCILAVLICNALRFKAAAKSAYVFLRIKCFFTLCMIFVFIVYHFFAKGSYNPDSVAIVLYYIGPLLMLLDWILFDFDLAHITFTCCFPPIPSAGQRKRGSHC